MKDPEYWQCSRRGCGWTGTTSEQAHRPDANGFTYVCPKCGCESFYREKPLFIPLKREYFEQFEAGTKRVEFRPHGPRWNDKTCHIGRAVILSLGYGKSRRIRGVVSAFYQQLGSGCPGWLECYGEKGRNKVAACIKIELESCGDCKNP